MRSSGVNMKLCFDKIMTNEVLFYDDAFEEDCKTFCEKRNITYLPSKKDNSSCYRLDEGEFKEKKIEETQKVDIEDKIFDNSIREKFEKHHVLFVFRRDDLCGVVHFCDYNKEPVSVYVYALLLEFERKLRELLICQGLNNKDMIDFFEEHVEKNRKDGHYSRKAAECRKEENQAKMRELESFQAFDLKDLIDLLHSKEIYEVPIAIGLNLRNAVMHTRNVVRHEDYESSGLIYTVESFGEFFELVNSLRSEIENVSRKVPLEADEGYIMRLKQAGLFVKL